ncbi:hypothetical protein NDU88_008010, partial [Pleurodeles waltl]
TNVNCKQGGYRPQNAWKSTYTWSGMGKGAWHWGMACTDRSWGTPLHYTNNSPMGACCHANDGAKGKPRQEGRPLRQTYIL